MSHRALHGRPCWVKLGLYGLLKLIMGNGFCFVRQCQVVLVRQSLPLVMQRPHYSRTDAFEKRVSGIIMVAILVNRKLPQSKRLSNL
jgi:hypothetical protein